MNTNYLKKITQTYSWKNSEHYKFSDSPDISEVAEVLKGNEGPIISFLDTLFKLYSDNKTFKEDETEFFGFFEKTYSVLNEKKIKAN